MYQGCRGHAEREPGKLSEAPPFRVLLLPVDQSSLQQFLLCQPGKVEPLPLFLSTWVADMSHQHESRLDLSVIVVTAFSCHSKAILLLALIQSTSLRVYESTSLRVYESRLYLKEVRAKRRTFRSWWLLSFPASGVFGAGAGHLKRKPSEHQGTKKLKQLKHCVRSAEIHLPRTWPGSTELHWNI